MAADHSALRVLRPAPGPGGEPPSGQLPVASFYFDLASPVAYLAAERAVSVLPQALDWRPVLARELPRAERHDAFRCAEEELVFRAEIARGAALQGLQPVVWPAPFPFDSELAMRVATYARGLGKATAFALAAFRQAFAGGRDLAREDNVLIAAAACEMHPRAVLAGARAQQTGRRLRTATAEAAAAGVFDVPAVALAGDVHVGAGALERAAAASTPRE